MLLVSMATYVVLPKDPVYESDSPGKSKVGITESTVEITESESDAPSFGFFGLLKIRNIVLYSVAGMCASMGVGFLTGN